MMSTFFSYIYGEVQEKSIEVWKFEKYELLKEFQKKPRMPFPFSIPENIISLLKHCKKTKDNNKQKGREYLFQCWVV